MTTNLLLPILMLGGIIVVPLALLSVAISRLRSATVPRPKKALWVGITCVGLNPFWDIPKGVLILSHALCETPAGLAVTRSVFTHDYKLFLQLLVDARTRAGLSQAELAQALSRPQSYVSKFERGERRIDVVELLDIADALKTDPASFVKRLHRERRNVARS